MSVSKANYPIKHILLQSFHYFKRFIDDRSNTDQKAPFHCIHAQHDSSTDNNEWGDFITFKS